MNKKPGEPVEEETLAASIRKISEALTKLTRSGLRREAVVILLHHETKISQRDIRQVLDTLGDLARRFTT